MPQLLAHECIGLPREWVWASSLCHDALLDVNRVHLLPSLLVVAFRVRDLSANLLAQLLTYVIDGPNIPPEVLVPPPVDLTDFFNVHVTVIPFYGGGGCGLRHTISVKSTRVCSARCEPSWLY